MESYVDKFVVGTYRSRPLMEALVDLDASGAIDTAARAIVVAKRFSDASKATALPDKLAGIIFRNRDGERFLGYAITPKDKRLRCRNLGVFASDSAATQAVAEAYGQRDVRPPAK